MIFDSGAYKDCTINGTLASTAHPQVQLSNPINATFSFFSDKGGTGLATSAEFTIQYQSPTAGSYSITTQFQSRS